MLRMYMKELIVRLSGVKHLIQGQYYSFRRTAIWPEAKYKRGMLKRIQRLYQYEYFVETGTLLGETPTALHRNFKHIWTIELDRELFMKAEAQLKRYPNITCIFGDSKEVLPAIISEIDSPTIFWLDAHYSGEGTAHGEIKAPMIEELEAIKTSTIKDHLIVIDDVSDFSSAEENRPLSEVLATIESINPKYKFYFDYDMLFALPFERVHREFWRKAVYPIVVR